MDSAFWRGYARGGALACWTAGPAMALVGVVTPHRVLIWLGGAAFAVGAAILVDIERGDGDG